MAGELWTRNARDLAAMIARGETTSTAVIEAHLDRIATVNPSLNAVVVVLTDDALKAAAEADRAVAAGQTLPPAKRSRRCTVCHSRLRTISTWRASPRRTACQRSPAP